MARTDTLGNFLTDVCNAVREKTGETGTIKASELDSKIATISGGGASKYKPRHISFYKYLGTDLDEELSNVDFSNITAMSGMFYGCNNLQSVNMDYIKATIDYSKLTDMDSIFYECKALTSIDMTNFNTSNVTVFDWLFAYCENLTSIDVSSFDTSAATDINNAFRGCASLKRLDLSTWDTSNVTDMSYLFAGCTGLEYLDIRKFDFTNVTKQNSIFGGGSGFIKQPAVPEACEIIVKDDTAKAWVLKQRSDFINVKTVAELETN